MSNELKTPALTNDLWEMTRTGLDTMMWGQDQMDALVRSGLDQAKTFRQEGHKVLSTALEQAKASQEDFNRKAEENVRSAMQMVPGMSAFLNR